jgi:peptidoglycan hydrolase-like protein with peptidoglycan-binding domain
MQFPISDSADVRELQQRLVDLGFQVSVDGILGPQTRVAVSAFQSENADAAGVPLVVDGIPGPITWASMTANAAPAAPAAPPAQTARPRAGFDTAFYPGDAQMQAWKESSPYSFVGYYLAAPVHPNSSWMGKRAKLLEIGWDLVPIYVGRQSQGPGSNVPPDAASGRAHGADALAKMRSEGFPAGSIVYLDVEPMDRIPNNMVDYVNAWLSEFVGRPYLPGVYCHVKNAVELKARTAETVADFPFWVSGSGHLTAGVTDPTKSGIPFATIWQGTFDQSKTFGGVTLNIDENVAQSASSAALS